MKLTAAQRGVLETLDAAGGKVACNRIIGLVGGPFEPTWEACAWLHLSGLTEYVRPDAQQPAAYAITEAGRLAIQTERQG